MIRQANSRSFPYPLPSGGAPLQQWHHREWLYDHHPLPAPDGDKGGQWMEIETKNPCIPESRSKSMPLHQRIEVTLKLGDAGMRQREVHRIDRIVDHQPYTPTNHWRREKFRTITPIFVKHTYIHKTDYKT